MVQNFALHSLNHLSCLLEHTHKYTDAAAAAARFETSLYVTPLINALSDNATSGLKKFKVRSADTHTAAAAASFMSHLENAI